MPLEAVNFIFTQTKHITDILGSTGDKSDIGRPTWTSTLVFHGFLVENQKVHQMDSNASFFILFDTKSAFDSFSTRP